MTDWTIDGGRVLREGALRNDALHLASGHVAAAGAQGSRFDATGLLVLPGIIDIHGDAHERQLQPRPGVDLPTTLAIRDSEAQILAAGITTAFLGVTLSWEPGLRSLPAWRRLLAGLAEARPHLAADLRVHLRFEADNLDALDEAVADIAAGRVHLLAFNDHTPGIARKLSDDTQAAKYAARAGIDIDRFRALADAAMARRGQVPEGRRQLAAAARTAGIAMASHDDATPADRQAYRALGAAICEFPMAEEVAGVARAEGEAVVMGAPNVVRGGSHLGWASAAPLAERGLVTVLASDYVWPALMEAAFVMADRGTMALPAAWDLISRNPAQATGLRDRGSLDVGMRGDVVVVDAARRAPVATFCAGTLAWIAPHAAGRLV
ncbi:alpha-D-ribose 1-methylphosphonate 5-triphosphate diphosphatase [Roseomonas haemaphysalidis]|uniref:Alpha-D-ribose 1-methylphosphonate 5-triphosphate diphosphatase n=1 Tax=Roseomonas haemaphysalidis TaxID=2768162 RepID=A0ABS3KWF4_9PROT|nr:alpha-D-ribose 1-methylphosphonate 5-triphosphate diphosphatase [Roseomonas haemaphysalidis]MBO1081779.1 alpha-D-ribose 1-methylphosphonate 5-triphosphate diphosphatase [Roseomonas haemaphysalidis]